MVVGLRSGKVLPARCGRLECSPCLAIEAIKYAAAIALAAPDQALLMTDVGDDWSTVQRRVNRVHEYLRRSGIWGEWVWQVEPNPSGTGQHVHAWRWGSARQLTEEALREVALRAGMGREVGVSAVVTAVGVREGVLRGAGAMRYGMKSAFIDVGDRELSAPQRAHLVANGGRLGHTSRGFWRDAAGRPLPGRKAAVAAARRAAPSGGRDTWSMMTTEAAATVLALPVG